MYFLPFFFFKCTTPLIMAAVGSCQPLQSIPAEKIMKKPIPDEHLVLKTTFEGLIQKCLAVATDPVSASWTSSCLSSVSVLLCLSVLSSQQTKRKLDDANKRLEALYDKLREQTVSGSVSRCYGDAGATVSSQNGRKTVRLDDENVCTSLTLTRPL